MRDGREHDLEKIRAEYYRTRDPRRRRELEDIGREIQRQRSNGKIASMRESLIKEMRQGNAQNVKDINLYVKNRSDYQ